MEKNPLNLDYLFEVSWEVCNLVGGIYTVLSTKAKTLQQINKDRNVFIGPDLWKEKESPYFIEVPSLFKDWKKIAAKEGLQVRTGIRRLLVSFQKRTTDGQPRHQLRSS